MRVKVVLADAGVLELGHAGAVFDLLQPLQNPQLRSPRCCSDLCIGLLDELSEARSHRHLVKRERLDGTAPASVVVIRGRIVVVQFVATFKPWRFAFRRWSSAKLPGHTECHLAGPSMRAHSPLGGGGASNQQQCVPHALSADVCGQAIKRFCAIYPE